MLYPEENNTINALNSVEKRASNLVYVVCDVYRKLHYINIHFFITYDICISKHAFSVTILQNIMCKCAKKMGERLCPPDPVPGLCPWTPLGTSVPRTSWLASIYSRLLWGESPPKKKFRNPPKIRRDRRTRGTNSWLDDTDKNSGPDFPLLFKLHKIWSVDSQENH